MKDNLTTTVIKERHKYTLVYREAMPYLKELNPFPFEEHAEFSSNDWSRFENKSEIGMLPLLNPIKDKELYLRDEFDIVEAYIKDGVLIFDFERPFYARNMGIRIIDAALVLPRPK